MKRPVLYPDTHEYLFEGKWYDAGSQKELGELSEAVKAAEEREIEEGDWKYHSRRDEKGNN